MSRPHPDPRRVLLRAAEGLRLRRRAVDQRPLPRRYRAVRATRRGHETRWIPSFLSLTSAIDNSRKDQTLNTPAVATLVLLAEQIEWMLAQGGLAWADARTRTTSGMVQAWAAGRGEITPFVTDAAARSQVVTTLDVDESIDATAVTSVLRAHGIVDIEPYRKLGRNQLRIATFPAVEEADVYGPARCARPRARPQRLISTFWAAPARPRHGPYSSFEGYGPCSYRGFSVAHACVGARSARSLRSASSLVPQGHSFWTVTCSAGSRVLQGH